MILHSVLLLVMFYVHSCSSLVPTNEQEQGRAGPGDEATLAAFFNAYNLHVLVSDPWREFRERGYTHVC